MWLFHLAMSRGRHVNIAIFGTVYAVFGMGEAPLDEMPRHIKGGLPVLLILDQK